MGSAMCRLFVLRANRPTRVAGSLLTAPHSLQRQSGCDRRGLCHESGWGIGYYLGDGPHRVRSARSALQDPRYRDLAGTVAACTVLAHIRLASMGSIAECNSHPFVYGAWMFAHNGTLFGFDTGGDRLRRLIPDHLRACIQGVTDSEHVFYFLLARLEEALGPLAKPAPADVLGRVVADAIRTLEGLFPGTADDRSQFNIAITDGRSLAASRWLHTLFWLERRDLAGAEGDGPVEETPGYHALAVASEPTTGEPWREVPDRAVLLIDPDLVPTVVPIPG
jgi:glutamine amidotransferase